MKTKNLLKTATILLGILLATAANSQIITHTDEIIQTSPSTLQGIRTYSVQGLIKTRPTATFSYLWWFGDNCFRFDSIPSYPFDYPTVPTDSMKMLSLVTENYGTAGPPPLPYTTNKYTNNVPLNIIPSGQSIYLQNYRNAVPHDTMYIIVTYQDTLNPGMPKSGSLRLELDPQLQFLSSFGVEYPQVYPNGEELESVNGQVVTFTFDNLHHHEERSILVPVYVSPSAQGDLNIDAFLETLGIDGEGNEYPQSYSDIIGVSVEVSHDPNMMSEVSNKERLCSVVGDTISYTVKFQNIGEATTNFIKVVCYLDDNVDLSTIDNIQLPEIYSSPSISNRVSNGYDVTNRSTWACWSVDPITRSITFDMNMLRLRSLNDPTCLDLNATRSEISFTVNVKSDYVFGPALAAEAYIYFDANEPIRTNTTYSGCENVDCNGNGSGYATSRPVKCAPICWYIIIGLAILIIILLLILILKRRKKQQK